MRLPSSVVVAMVVERLHVGSWMAIAPGAVMKEQQGQELGPEQGLGQE